MKHTAKSFLLVAATAFPLAATAGAFGSSAVKDASVSNSAAAGNSVWCERIEANVPERLAGEMNCDSAGNRRGLRGFFASLGSSKSGPSDDNDNDDVVRRPLPPTTTVSTDPDPTPPTGTPPAGDPPSSFVSKADRLADFGTTFETLGEMSDQFQEEARAYREEHGGRGDWAGFSPSVGE